MKNTFLSRFTPSLMTPEALEAIFVQRHQLVDDLVEAIRESVLTANKHFRLLVGARGMGKTHTIALTYYRISAMEDLRDRLLIAWLREEEWGVSSFLDLLLRIFRALEQAYPEEYEAKLKQEVESLYQVTADEAENKSSNLLREFAGKRTLLLLMENLDDIFDGLGDIGQKQLRAYIQNNSFITILATTQSLFNGITQKESPFYGFFYPHHLEELNLNDVVALLKRISELEGDKELESFIGSATGLNRIKAIHYLAGGNHRVYVIFAEFLTRKSLDELVEPFMKTLDELTPYYQARMAWLSQQQRKIVEFLCDRRYAVTVKEISQRCFISHQTASSQLKDLREKGYVKSETIGRESFYELREVLMRFCLEVKKQRGEPISLFVDFLRNWYTQDELQHRLERLMLEVTASDDPPQSRDFRDRMDNGLPQKSDLGTIDKCFEQQTHPGGREPWQTPSFNPQMELEYISKALQIKGEEKEDPRIAAYKQEYQSCHEKRDFKIALQNAEKLTQLRGNAEDWLDKGICLRELTCYDEALMALSKAIEFYPDYLLAWAWRGYVLQELKRYKEALVSCDKAIKLDPNYRWAWLMRSNVLKELRRYEEALVSCNKSIELNPSDRWAWILRGNVLQELKRYEEALVSCDKAIELDPKYLLAWAWRSHVLAKLNQYEEALVSCNKVIDLDPNYQWAWANQAYVLKKLNQYEEALVSSNKAIELDPNNNRTWANRGSILKKLQRYEEALASCNKAIELDPNYCWALVEQGDVLKELQDYDEALVSCDKAIKLTHNCRCAWTKRGDVLKKLQRYEEALASCDKAIELGIQSSSIFLNRSISLLALNCWDEGIVALASAMEHLDNATELDPTDTESIIRNLFGNQQDTTIWQSRIKSLIELYDKHQIASALGQGIVHCIPALMSEMVSNKATRVWLEVWQELAGDRPEFQIPLRLLNAAVRYRETKGDRRVLLELPVEERNLLQPLLEIGDTQSALSKAKA